MRYLFCSFDTYGFLNPSVAIATELRQRGHEVAFVVDRSMQVAVERIGFQRIPRGAKDGNSFQVVLSGDPTEIVRQVLHLEYAIQQFSPDVLIGQQVAFGPLIAGERHHLPVAMIGMAAYLWQTGNIAKDTEIVNDRYEGFLATYVHARNVFFAEKAVPPCSESPLIGDLFLLRSTPEFEGDAESLPNRVHFIGDCLYDIPQADEALSSWLSTAVVSKKPIIYLQPVPSSATPNLWETLVEALYNQPIYVIGSTGRMAIDFDAIPDNFFMRKHISQEQVLPYADAVISGATTTAVLGALTHGLPLLLIPGHATEVWDIIQRCINQRVALYLRPKQLTADCLKTNWV